MLIELGGHVPGLAEQIHHFVIAKQGLQPAASGRRLWFERDEQIEHGSSVLTAIQEIAGLNQDGSAAGPLSAGIDQAGSLEN